MRARFVAFEDDLLALRAGRLSFDKLARRMTPDLQARAEYYLRRYAQWGQAHVSVEDLVQDMLLAVWRAVDLFDPSRAVAIHRFVDMRVGGECEFRVRQACAYPDAQKRSGKALPRTERIESFDVFELDSEDPTQTLDRCRLVRYLARANKRQTTELARRVLASGTWNSRDISGAHRAMCELALQARSAAGGIR